MIQTADVNKLKCIYQGIIKDLVDVDWYGLNCNTTQLKEDADYIKLLIDVVDITPTICRSLECKILEVIESKANYCINCTTPCTKESTSSATLSATITCPANITASTAVGQSTVVVTYTLPTYTTNCPYGVTLTRTAGLASGSAFPIGVTTVTHRLQNSCGTNITCSFTVTVSSGG